MPTLKLTYFNSKAKAEGIRLALFVSGVDFQDCIVDHQQFAPMKSTFPFGQLPVLEVDGEMLSQSMAILVYAGKLTGLIPEDPLGAAKVMQILGAVDDIMRKISPSIHEPDQQKKTEARAILAAETLPFWLSRLDKVVASGGSEGHCVGGSLTIADLQVYVLCSWLTGGILDGIPKTICDQEKSIIKVVGVVKNNPKVQEWNAAHAK